MVVSEPPLNHTGYHCMSPPTRLLYLMPHVEGLVYLSYHRIWYICFLPSNLHLQQATMSKNNSATASRSSTSVDAQILEFANSSLSLKQLTRRAVSVLTTFKDSPQTVLDLTPGDQEKCVDKIDQACQRLLEILGPSLPQRHSAL